jgi:threonine dehydratase
MNNVVTAQRSAIGFRTEALYPRTGPDRKDIDATGRDFPSPAGMIHAAAMTPPAPLPVSIDAITAAAGRLHGRAVRTPLIAGTVLDALTGGRILLKAETLQRHGSFKLRGAYNALAVLDPAVRARGMVAWSSGNHAQGVAAAARLFGVAATIVMPADAPADKLSATRALGADVVTYDRWTESREDIGRAIAAERGATIVPPYDDPAVIAGQGTVGLEIAEDAAAQGFALDDVLVPCSGGGLAAGIATALAARSPATRVWAVEPAGFDDTARSLAAGRRLANDPDARSICDALLVPIPGELTFAINRTRLAGGLVADDAEVFSAMAFSLRRLKLVVEPGGAVALAALLAGRIDAAGRTVAVVLSGGNAAPELLARALAETPG